ncbi:MAG TPA: hypothetical protein VIM62_01080 [Acidobacteriaceae bacterium]
MRFRSFSIRRIILSSTFLAAAAFLFNSSQAKALGPHGDISAGYSRLFNSGADANGWQVDGHLKMAPFLGAEAGVSGYGGGNDYLYLFGPRATVSAANLHLFAHFLIGGEHSGGVNEFVYGGGGGVDVSFFPHLAWRFAGDGFREPSPGVSFGRFTTGPVLRF